MTRRYRSLAADFPVRLVETRELAGLTQGQLGEKLGWPDRQRVSKLETGETGAHAALVAELAGALGVAPAWLAYGVELPGGDGGEDYSARLRRARAAVGLSGEALAQRARLKNRSSISHLESPRSGRRLDLDLCELLAGALGVSPAWLAFGVGEGPAS